MNTHVTATFTFTQQYTGDGDPMKNLGKSKVYMKKNDEISTSYSLGVLNYYNCALGGGLGYVFNF